MADRILGMGDVVSLIEKATENIDEDEAMKIMEKIQKGTYNYNDFLKQLKWIKRMGSMKSLLSMIPGLGSKLKDLDIDDKQFTNIEVIISSMTPKERKNPDLVAKSPSRRNRICKGSGRSYQEVNALTRKFDDMKNSLKQMAGMDPEKMGPNARPPMPSQKPRKGKGKGRGDFRIR